MINEAVPPLTNGTILLVEDDSQDIELFRLALAQSGSFCKVIAVNFARDAIMYLGQFGEYADQTRFPKPTLIVLDLSLPGMSGFDFLAWAKGEPAGTIPPIVVLSSSKNDLHRTLTERLGAKAHFVKSPDLHESSATAKELLLFNTPPPNFNEPNPSQL